MSLFWKGVDIKKVQKKKICNGAWSMYMCESQSSGCPNTRRNQIMFKHDLTQIKYCIIYLIWAISNQVLWIGLSHPGRDHFHQNRNVSWVRVTWYWFAVSLHYKEAKPQQQNPLHPNIASSFSFNVSLVRRFKTQ